MSMNDNATLIKLSDTDQTVANFHEDVRGRKVKDKDSNDVGTVHDLLIDDQERKVRFLLVEHGGFLGVGETKTFIPIDAIIRITDDSVYLNDTREHIARAPRYDPRLVDNRAYYGSIYDYWGHTPYWGAQYTYPTPWS